MVVDATHLRKERLVQIERVKTHTKLIVILVVHAEEGVVRRWAREHGMNTNGESAEDAVMRVRGYFEERYKHGEWTWPSAEMDGVKVMEVWNE